MGRSSLPMGFLVMGHGLWVGPWVFFRFNVSKYTLYLANLGMGYDPWVMVHGLWFLPILINYYNKYLITTFLYLNGYM